MAEILPSARWETISQEQKQIPSALQELKKLIGPSNITIVTQAYESFSDSQKVSLLQKIQENHEELATFIEMEDDTSLQTLLKKIIAEMTQETKTQQVETKTQQVETKTQQVETKTQQVETKTQQVETKGKEIDKGVERRESLLKEAREQRDAAFKLFGNEDGFNQKFGKDAIKWREKATKKVLSEPGADKLSEEEKKTRIDVSLLVTNREAIAAGLPEGAARTEFNAIAGKLNFLATELRIPIEPRLAHVPITDAERNKLTTELIGLKPTDRVTQVGSEFRYGNERDGYQIVDMSTRPPTRSIEQNGIRITEPNTKKKKDYYEQADRYEAEYDALNKEIGDIEGDVKSEISILKQYADRLNLGSVDKLDSLTYDRILQALGKELQGAEKGTPEYEDIDRLGAQIYAHKQKYLEQGGLQERQQKLTELIRKRDSLEIEKILHRERYLNTLESETESNRSNLEYIGSTHLTSLLGDSGIKLLVEQINETTPDKFSHLALETQWWRKEKELFAGGLRRLLGIDTKNAAEFFESDGYTVKQYAPDMKTPMETLLKERLEKNGVYGGIPPTVIQERLVGVMNGERRFS